MLVSRWRRADAGQGAGEEGMMDPQLLGIVSAFGLASAAGLNTTLPLFLVGLLHRVGALALAAPFDALGSDVALAGLAVLALLEFGADKVPGFDSVAHTLQWPLTLTAGAVLFASQASVITEVSPGLAILVGVLTAGGVHAVRAAVRPMLTASTFGLANPAASLAEDVLAGGLVLLAALLPLLLPLALLGLILGLALLIRRVAARLPRGGPRQGPRALPSG
jgi:hypothetical protein